MRESRSRSARMPAISREIVEAATGLGTTYRRRALDAVHLATAVHVGADFFVTDNTRDFDPGAIAEVDVLTPEQL